MVEDKRVEKRRWARRVLWTMLVLSVTAVFFASFPVMAQDEDRDPPVERREASPPSPRARKSRKARRTRRKARRTRRKARRTRRTARRSRRKARRSRRRTRRRRRRTRRRKARRSRRRARRSRRSRRKSRRSRRGKEKPSPRPGELPRRGLKDDKPEPADRLPLPGAGKKRRRGSLFASKEASTGEMVVEGEGVPEGGTTEGGDISDGGVQERGLLGDGGPPESAFVGERVPEGMAREVLVEGLADRTGARASATTPPAGPTPPAAAKGAVQKDSALAWELRGLWLVAALLLLSLVLQLFHFLLPFRPLRFLSHSSHALLWASSLLLLLLFGGYRVFWLRESPTQTLYHALLWFSLVVLWSHLLGRKRFPNIYIHALPVLLVALGGVLWAVSTALPLPQQIPTGTLLAPWRQVGLVLLFAGFGLAATAASWQLIAGFLAMLGRRFRGSGYGLASGDGERFRLMPPRLVVLAFPLLTLGLACLLGWSIHTYGHPWNFWLPDPRLFAGLITWVLLGAYLWSLRTPKWRESLAGFFLLLATGVGALVFFFGFALFKVLQG